MYYLRRVSMSTINACFYGIWLGEVKEREAVVEFCDNPPYGFQQAVNLVFIGLSQEFSYKE